MLPKLTVKYDVLPALFTSKKFSCEFVPPLPQNAWLSALKSLSYCEIVTVSMIAGIMLKNISVRDLHAIVIRNLGRLTFSRKTSANILKLDAPK